MNIDLGLSVPTRVNMLKKDACKGGLKTCLTFHRYPKKYLMHKKCKINFT